MSDRELMQQALEALRTLHDENMDYLTRNNLGGENNQCMVFARETITALRERLAQPVQEPLATVESVATVVSESGNQEITMSWWHEPALPVGTKLYTTLPQRKPLTDEEILDATCHLGGWNIDVARCVINHARAIEAKLKEKNT
jgi:hypothetical protein